MDTTNVLIATAFYAVHRRAATAPEIAEIRHEMEKTSWDHLFTHIEKQEARNSEGQWTVSTPNPSSTW